MGVLLVVGERPAPKNDVIRVALAIKALSSIKNMEVVDQITLYEYITSLVDDLRNKHGETLTDMKKTLVPPHVSWQKLAKDLLRLEIILVSEDIWR